MLCAAGLGKYKCTNGKKEKKNTTVSEYENKFWASHIKIWDFLSSNWQSLAAKWEETIAGISMNYNAVLFIDFVNRVERWNGRRDGYLQLNIKWYSQLHQGIMHTKSSGDAIWHRLWTAMVSLQLQIHYNFVHFSGTYLIIRASDFRS